jgi:rare lipoprotein A
MPHTSQPYCVATTLPAKLLAIATIGMIASTPLPAVAASSVTVNAHPSQRAKLAPKPRLDLSGRKRTGIASFYAERFAGRKMANGARMNPRGNNAASRTLPLGTLAKVTNLKTQRSAIVTIQDRGPYVKGRIVDLSPSTARKIGITRRMGIAKVRVTPLVIPLPDGSIRVARASQEASRYPSDRLQ